MREWLMNVKQRRTIEIREFNPLFTHMRSTEMISVDNARCYDTVAFWNARQLNIFVYFCYVC